MTRTSALGWVYVSKDHLTRALQRARDLPDNEAICDELADILDKVDKLIDKMSLHKKNP